MPYLRGILQPSLKDNKILKQERFWSLYFLLFFIVPNWYKKAFDKGLFCWQTLFHRGL